MKTRITGFPVLSDVASSGVAASAVILAAVCIFCSGQAARGQRLFPVQGPAATQAAPQAFTAKLSNIFKASGAISLVQEGGETGENFQGKWTTVTATFINEKTPGAPASYPPQPNLAFAWDVVYGQGYYSANVLGSQALGQAIATGNHGTILQVEFEKWKLGGPVDNIFGVAVDNKGNIYKVVL